MKVLKSKGTNIKVTQCNIGLVGAIKLPKQMMDDLNIVEDEMVIVHGQYGKQENNIFVETSGNDDVISPYGLAGVGELITVISMGTATVDEPIVTAIRVDFS
jgi:aspartate 1-decarboxylase